MAKTHVVFQTFCERNNYVPFIFCSFAEINVQDLCKIKKSKEEALAFIKKAIQHKEEWKRELEIEFKSQDVNVEFL